jgi:hypothetical protein
MMEIDLANRVALRVAVCSHMVEEDPQGRLPRQIVEAMRRRVAAESDAAIRLHNEATPNRPYERRSP